MRALKVGGCQWVRRALADLRVVWNLISARRCTIRGHRVFGLLLVCHCCLTARHGGVLVGILKFPAQRVCRIQGDPIVLSPSLQGGPAYEVKGFSFPHLEDWDAGSLFDTISEPSVRFSIISPRAPGRDYADLLPPPEKSRSSRPCCVGPPRHSETENTSPWCADWVCVIFRIVFCVQHIHPRAVEA